MGNESSTRHEVLSSEEARAKAAILAECENLAAAGVTFVAVHLAGPNGVGKTTFARKFLPKYANCKNFANALKDWRAISASVKAARQELGQTHST